MALPMKKRWLSTALPVLGGMLLAACQTAPPPVMPAAAGIGAAGIGVVWFSPPADFPGICLTLAGSGTLEFAGGFTFYNPGRWTYDAAAAQLRIELGGKQPFPLEQAQQQLKKKAGALVRIDAAKRALVYAVGPATESLTLGGFVFYRKLACDS